MSVPTLRLGEPAVARIINGQSPPSSAYNTSGDGLPFYQGKADFGSLFPTPRVWATEGPKRAQAKDVLISVRAPVGDVNMATGDCVIGRGVAAVRAGSNSDPWFLYFALQHLKPTLEARATGSTFASINGTTLADLNLPRFELGDQEKIGRALKRIAQHAHNEEVSANACRELKDASMRALFTRGLRSEGQRDSEIGPVPESWEVAALGSVRDWLQYGTSVRCGHEPTVNPVLRIPNIASGRVNTLALKYGTLSAEEAARYRLEVGDLLFIRTNGVIERLGDCAVFDGEPAGALFASYLIRARLDTKRVHPRFVAHFFGSELGRAIIAGRATPAADGKYNLNTGTIDRLPIPLPTSLDEQREIARTLDALDQKCELHRRKRAVLDELFNVLLHKLMTGEIRVADLNLDALTATSSVVGAFA